MNTPYRYILPVIFSLISVLAVAQSAEHSGMTGVDTIPAAFFRERYHRGDLLYYLEALNDHSIVENHITGEWWIPDPLTISIEGVGYTHNRFYLDGFRVDDRFQPGSTRYVPNMQRYNLQINTHSSQIYFEQDTSSGSYLQAVYNFGQIGNGEPMPGTAAIIHLFHRTPMESADTYKHVSARRHQKGAGTIDGAYIFRDKDGNKYRQHLTATYGERLITREDQCGLITQDPFYTAPYYKVQMDGRLPIKPNSAFESVNYLLHFGGQTDAESAYLYNYDEVYDLKNYTGSIYAKRPFLTTGLTWATNVTNHKNREFRKNLVDQDGESFFPWLADGTTHEFSWAVNYEQPVFEWSRNDGSHHVKLRTRIDAYNSLFHFTPKVQSWSNSIYLQAPTADFSAAPVTELYRYEWDSRSYTAGLLENTVGIALDYVPNRLLSLHAAVDFTLDGMVLRNKTKISPNGQARVQMDLHPCSWFEMGLTAGYYRLAYTSDYLRYMSQDYLNGEIYYAGTNTLAATTGGKYHQYQSKLQQTSYVELDLPIRLHWGRHEIVLQQSYKKFYHAWHTAFADGIDQNGYFMTKTDPIDPAHDERDIYYTYDGEKQYVVSEMPATGSNLLMNTPYYFSQLSRYTYNGKQITFSLSWQSMQAAGFSGLGNGANMNTMGILSESTANPNTQNVITNPGAKYAGVSRYDLDKGFVCRIFFSYNICKWVQMGITAKWTDGKPFSAYRYYQDGNQVAICPLSSRGTNPTDGNFGTRHGAVFNLDAQLQGSWWINGYPMRLKLECYNVWDFCHDQAEMAFVQDIPYARRASVIMNVPVGILLTYSVDLDKINNK